MFHCFFKSLFLLFLSSVTCGSGGGVGCGVGLPWKRWVLWWSLCARWMPSEEVILQNFSFSGENCWWRALLPGGRMRCWSHWGLLLQDPKVLHSQAGRWRASVPGWEVLRIITSTLTDAHACVWLLCCGINTKRLLIGGWFEVSWRAEPLQNNPGHVGEDRWARSGFLSVSFTNLSKEDHL